MIGSMGKFDLKAYLERIHYAGKTSPSLDVLNGLTEAHAKSIPFENIDAFLDRGISLSSDAIFTKLVTQKRGGYCFEQNSLFLSALESMGFSVKPLSGRVRLRFTSRDQAAPRTHMFLQVEIDGSIFLTDVGMGSASLTGALKLTPDLVQVTPHDSRRLVRESGLWYHQVLYGQTWQDACEFTLEQMPPVDQEIANWFTSTHPQSHFRDRVVASRALENGERVSLQNFELTRRSRTGEAEKKFLKNPLEIMETLTDQFGLVLSEADGRDFLVKMSQFR